MKTIVIATGNEHKVQEIRQIIGDDLKLISMKEAGISCDIEENGATFAENAMIKAREVKKYWDGPVVADDSGLCIDALGGDPGVHSARFLGEDTPYSEKNAKILEMLKDVPETERGARFVCSVACILEDGREVEVEGTIEGRIAYAPAGENGFGYDPVFYVPKFGCTTAELSSEAKNEISHRGKAFDALRDVLLKEK